MGAYRFPTLILGAGDEARTRDIQFGKLKLYQLSYTRAFYCHNANWLPATAKTLVEEAGFEPAYSERTDLQSVAFNHSATPPNRTLDYAVFSIYCQTNGLIYNEKLVPDVGIELTTFALQVRCSTNWANPAFLFEAWL